MAASLGDLVMPNDMREPMQHSNDFYFELDSGKVADSELVDLLTSAYVGGGFTSPERATSLFAPKAIRSRGQMIFARTQTEHSLAGMVIVVLPHFPARRIAEVDEAELHLLAVAPLHHGRGLGRALIDSALESIHAQGFRKTVLWTQPSMVVAHRLYERTGFVRAVSRDPTMDDIEFLAYEKSW